MKKFEEFIKEANHPDNFIFMVIIKDSSPEELDRFYELAKSYFFKFERFYPYEEFINDINKNTPLKAWSLLLNIYYTLSNMNFVPSTSITYIHSPGWGSGYESVTLNELLKIGFKDIEEYIKMKNNAEKFNL